MFLLFGGEDKEYKLFKYCIFRIFDAARGFCLCLQFYRYVAPNGAYICWLFNYYFFDRTNKIPDNKIKFQALSALDE